MLALFLAVAFLRPSPLDDARFHTFVVDPRVTPIELVYERPDGTRYGNLGAVADAPGRRLVFAANAGMYHPDRRPVGLYVEHGKERAKLVRGASSGNFGWKPNGVFLVRKDGRAEVVTTEAWRHDADIVWATQWHP